MVVSPSKEGSDEETSKKDEEGDKEPAVEEMLQGMPNKREAQKASDKPEFEFTPNAPAWTPGGVKGKLVSTSVPPVVKAEDSGASSSSGTIPEGVGGERAMERGVAHEPTAVPAGKLNP